MCGRLRSGPTSACRICPTIGKRPVLVEWQGFPDDRLNTAFVERVTEALAPIGADRDSELFFICRSGSEA